MAMRITQGMLYSSSLYGMNKALSDLQESNIQSASMLKINRPSDDPAGAGRVISMNASLNKISLYEENISTATGWLGTADAVLSSEGSVQSILTNIKTLAQQAASGTYNEDNREQIAYQVREYYNQLIEVANTSYAGSYIFSGTKTGSGAYEAGLGVTLIDSGTGLDDADLKAGGGSDKTVLIQATSSGNAETASYRWTNDGGTTWHDIDASDIAETAPGSGRLRITAGASGVSVEMNMGAQVTSVDIQNEHSDDNGSWMYVRPTAIYKGDDHDTQVAVAYGNSNSLDASANGSFSRDVAVRIDKVETDPVSGNDIITYSYSTDDGSTWSQLKGQGDTPTKLSVPGGYLDLSGVPAAGDQYIIHPHRAEVTLQISSTDSIALNLVGKDVFGGMYENPETGALEVVENGGNIFEVVGNLIAALETNSQQGVQESLEALDDCMNVVLTKAAVVGGRENRLVLTESALLQRKYNEEDALSLVKDADLTELSTRLAMQQVAYSSVLKSSSMIMQMSLVNYL
ncbi:flagellar biosynthesis protein FlgL [Desulfovibrio sp. OttesenSCG-928-G15]|nr:flagellar biosynthesis protein FlgL [Desulfovibrio sp. OttesenSCG-928-G15]